MRFEKCEKQAADKEASKEILLRVPLALPLSYASFETTGLEPATQWLKITFNYRPAARL